MVEVGTVANTGLSAPVVEVGIVADTGLSAYGGGGYCS